MIVHRGTWIIQENEPPKDPTVGLCLGSYGGLREVGDFVWARYPCRVRD